MTSRLTALVALVPLLVAADGLATSKAAVQGLEHVARLKPSSGFIDRAMAFSDDSKLLAYVETDSASKTTLRVYDIAKGMHTRKVDLSGLSHAIVGIHFVSDERLAVLSKSADGTMKAGIVRGHALRKTIGPHDRISFTKGKGGRALLLVEDVAKVTGKDGEVDKHTFRALDASTGRRQGRATELTLDDIQRDKERRFRVVYWRDGRRVAVGIKEGTYSRKLDQKLPDTEAWFDVLTGKFVANKVIKDFVAHRKLMETFEAHQGQSEFAFVARDLSGVKVVFDGTPRPIKLAGEPFYHYDRKSLASQQLADGSVLFSLTIDPVHPDAAARRRAVPVWLDFYRVAKGDKSARRVARIRIKDRRERSWLAGKGHLAVLTRHKTFGRGGPYLDLYRLR